jgi:hypothetical protein
MKNKMSYKLKNSRNVKSKRTLDFKIFLINNLNLNFILFKKC